MTNNFQINTVHSDLLSKYTVFVWKLFVSLPINKIYKLFILFIIKLYAQINPLMPGGNKKVTHIYLLKYMWPICYHQASKELTFSENVMCYTVSKKHCSIFPNFLILRKTAFHYFASIKFEKTFKIISKAINLFKSSTKH